MEGRENDGSPTTQDMTNMHEWPWIDKEKDGAETPSMLIVILICDRLRLMQRGCSQRVP